MRQNILGLNGQIEYGVIQLNRIKVVQEIKTTVDDDGVEHKEAKVTKTPKVEIGGQEFQTSMRFWSSVFSRYGFGGSIFKYFSHAEVFQRISDKLTGDEAKVRFCVEHDRGTNHHKLLAVSTPGVKQLEIQPMLEVLAKANIQNLKYNNGILSAAIKPPSGDHEFQIGGDKFINSLLLDIPIDCYGDPSFYLSLLRQACKNGMVAYCPTFRSSINIKKEPYHVLARAIESYDNDQGFAKLQERMEMAQKSYASMKECNTLLAKLQTLPAGLSFIKDYDKMTGNLPVLYGYTNPNEYPLKRQAVIPSKCRVAELLNFASELATHKLPVNEANVMDAFCGTLLSEQFDLEGLAEKVPDFKDFLTTPDEDKVKKAKIKVRRKDVA